MPELPEVETVRRSLEPRLLGRHLGKVEVRSPSLREPLDRPTLEALEGQRVEALRRRAKYLLIDLERQTSLVIHLGMSGRFTIASADTPVDRHEHLAFHLSETERLRFVDPRRFGLAFALPTASIPEDRHFVHLGVEPLGTDFGPKILQRLAQGRRGPVKNFLMDGRVVVGGGNIYASEALHRAHVRPTTAAGRIRPERWQRIVDAVKETLADRVVLPHDDADI